MLTAATDDDALIRPLSNPHGGQHCRTIQAVADGNRRYGQITERANNACREKEEEQSFVGAF